MRCLLVILGLSGLAWSQDGGRNRVTLSAGSARQINAKHSTPETAPVVGIGYGRRILPFMEIEAGVTVGLQPSPAMRGAFYDYDPNDRYIWVPFGVRFVAPLVAHRLEFSAGGGGLFERYSISNPDAPFGFGSHNGWGGYVSAGAALAVDRRHRFWLGVTPRALLANPKYGRDRWFTLTGDVSVRF